ncbi:uncharacterized protein LOC122630610 isoform X2 [Vespula pensylvanica]|uniref:uncharacterized protein LOC122630610 isoform X2 n=1 Tax=Vespula pensylvanica TaxID=30213 RepID=UPI001CB9F49C|nr:uncharacterized protein LOC122630610 isoform X2 [Vespula pensylvanica]
MSLISGICNSLSTMPALYKSQFLDIDEEPSNSKCLFCENSFILPTNEKDFLTHLFKEHRVVIADVWKIASLKSYIRYWSNRFKEHPITDFCTTILMDCTPDGKPSKDESYFLLSDCISEDKALRDEVYKVKLKNYRYAKDIELSSESEDEELSWSDWNDESISIFCLFCNHSDKDFSTILQHIKEQHNFDFKEASKDLTFYQKVKLVNYIRVRIYMQCCILCEIKSDNILEHMTQQDHYKLPKQYIWDHPAFYFPMNENDSFLYNLDTDDNSDESDIESTFKDLSITPDDNTNNYSDSNRLIKIRVEGLITTIAFHEARLYAEKLSQYLSQKYAVPQIRGMFQVDWYEYLRKMKVRVGGKMWALKRDVAVFINDVFIGSDIEFLEYLNELYVFHMPKDIGYYETHVKGYYKEFIKKTKEREPWIDVGENNMVHQYPYNTYSDISVWLNNVIDEIDIRDTASLLIAERYLSSLYCLSTDYLPEVNTYNLETNEEFYKSVNLDSKLNLCELLTDLRPEEMSKAEKEIFVKKLSRIIISYILNTVDHKSYALKDIYGSVHRILECAYDIARASIAKLLKQRINIKDASAEITKQFKIQQQDDKKITDSSLALIEEILNKSILHALESTNLNCE